jgi:parvulin-like peptidyl-prolyl isomerase
LALVLLLSACSHDGGGDNSGAPAQPVSAERVESSKRAPAYPRGRWRLTSNAQLDGVALWLSHILIQHDQVQGRDVSFNLADWRTSLPEIRRSRDAALELAQNIAREATRRPDAFSRLASEHSDDPVTRASGGSLGGISALQLYRWPMVLDAIAALPVGEVSNPVETERGFHVFYRRPPPEEERVSGQRIIIAHDDAPWIEVGARGGIPTRSREQARALAQTVYEQASAAPAAFERLVEQYSEHQDAARAGYFGTWSSRESSPFPRELETLRGMAVGQLAPPMETLFGYAILKRIDRPERDDLAMARIELRYNPQLKATEAGSQRATLDQARSLIDVLEQHPERFEELQKQYCCDVVSRVRAGRSPTAIETALLALKPGEMSRAPVPIYTGYLIVKRLGSAALPPLRPTRFELPSPEQPDMAYFMEAQTADFIERQLHLLGEKASALLGDGASRDALSRQHDLPGRFMQTTLEQRLALLNQLDTGVQAILTPAGYAQYRRIAQEHFEQVMLEAD